MNEPEESFPDLGADGDGRPVQLVNEYYRPQGAASRAERHEFQRQPVLIGFDDIGQMAWIIPWANIEQVERPAAEGETWTVRVGDSPASGRTIQTRSAEPPKSA